MKRATPAAKTTSPKKPATPAPAKTLVADLLYGDSCSNANIRWASRVAIGDPFIVMGLGKKRIGAVSLLEVQRAQAESAFTHVLCMGDILAGLKKTKPDAGVPDIIAAIAKDNAVSGFRVPEAFPLGIADALRALGFTVAAATGEFFPARLIKAETEQAHIVEGNKASSAGFAAVERILAESTIGKGGVLAWKGKTLTSERVQTEIALAAAALGAAHTAGLIVAGGEQGVDCHCRGSGPIKAGELIVVDIFPQNLTTGYFGDMTRTYAKGPVSAERSRLVKTVRAAHTAGLAAVKAGVPTHVPYDAAMAVIEAAGYQTGKTASGVPMGFFHGLGHGLGLDVHEAPRLGKKSPGVLEEGMVVTIEPGLYYPGIGGCRIEDVIVVTKTGHKLLSKHSYRWQIA